MLEFALVLPLLALLAFGTAEMGLAWTAHNRIEGAVSTAARVGSSTGQDANADVNILVALRAALPAEALANLDRVVIFKPAERRRGHAGHVHVRAGGGELEPGGFVRQLQHLHGRHRPHGHHRDEPGRGRRQLGRPHPQGRARRLRWPDYIGVYVRTRYDSKTGTFFGDITITRTSIYRIQPDIDG